MYEKTCGKCKNTVSFEEDLKTFKCPDCGADNPVPGIGAYLLAAVFVYLLIEFLFWVMPG